MMALIDDAPTRPCCLGGARGEPGLIDGGDLIDGCDWCLNEWWWWWWLIDNVTLIDGALGLCGFDIPKVTICNHLFFTRGLHIARKKKNQHHICTHWYMESTHEHISLGDEISLQGIFLLFLHVRAPP
jgi:hypothetical protein